MTASSPAQPPSNDADRGGARPAADGTQASARAAAVMARRAAAADARAAEGRQERTRALPARVSAMSLSGGVARCAPAPLRVQPVRPRAGGPAASAPAGLAGQAAAAEASAATARSGGPAASAGTAANRMGGQGEQRGAQEPLKQAGAHDEDSQPGARRSPAKRLPHEAQEKPDVAASRAARDEAASPAPATAGHGAAAPAAPECGPQHASWDSRGRPARPRRTMRSRLRDGRLHQLGADASSPVPAAPGAAAPVRAAAGPQVLGEGPGGAPGARGRGRAADQQPAGAPEQSQGLFWGQLLPRRTPEEQGRAGSAAEQPAAAGADAGQARGSASGARTAAGATERGPMDDGMRSSPGRDSTAHGGVQRFALGQEAALGTWAATERAAQADAAREVRARARAAARSSARPDRATAPARSTADGRLPGANPAAAPVRLTTSDGLRVPDAALAAAPHAPADAPFAEGPGAVGPPSAAGAGDQAGVRAAAAAQGGVGADAGPGPGAAAASSAALPAGEAAPRGRGAEQATAEAPGGAAPAPGAPEKDARQGGLAPPAAGAGAPEERAGAPAAPAAAPARAQPGTAAAGSSASGLDADAERARQAEVGQLPAAELAPAAAPAPAPSARPAVSLPDMAPPALPQPPGPQAAAGAQAGDAARAGKAKAPRHAHAAGTRYGAVETGEPRYKPRSAAGAAVAHWRTCLSPERVDCSEGTEFKVCGLAPWKRSSQLLRVCMLDSTHAPDPAERVYWPLVTGVQQCMWRRRRWGRPARLGDRQAAGRAAQLAPAGSGRGPPDHPRRPAGGARDGRGAAAAYAGCCDDAAPGGRLPRAHAGRGRRAGRGSGGPLRLPGPGRRAACGARHLLVAVTVGHASTGSVRAVVLTPAPPLWQAHEL